jgi:hypothetical protein
MVIVSSCIDQSKETIWQLCYTVRGQRNKWLHVWSATYTGTGIEKVVGAVSIAFAAYF